MNVHHLELFYYVAKHGGISAAVRAIPYGIQQPAVSGQMGKLEEDLGVKLFERSPFKLTTTGMRLFAHVQPFFEGLEAVGERMREAVAPRLRVGAAELISANTCIPWWIGCARTTRGCGWRCGRASRWNSRPGCAPGRSTSPSRRSRDGRRRG